MAKDRPTFENALSGLEKAAEEMIRHDSTLEDAIKNFEKGIQYYKQCNEILEEAKQKIEIYSK